MTRFDRPDFESDLWDLRTAAGPARSQEEQNRLLFDWWCDNGTPPSAGAPARESDRLAFIQSRTSSVTPFPSRAIRADDPAPLLTARAPEGFRTAYLVRDADDVHEALTDTRTFSNVPYAALGGASFLLGQDPPQRGEIDWHAEQRALITEAFKPYLGEPALWDVALRAVEQAALTSLVRPQFDLAQFAEQAALRYASLLFGYAVQDFTLLQDASRATYRALQYVAVGQHFVTEPLTLPAAQEALGRLIDRTSALVDEYTRLARSPRTIHSPRRFASGVRDDWPVGVQPWSDLGMSALGEPLLKRLPGLHGTRKTDRELSGRDRAIVASTSLAGTLGNVQSAVCLATRAFLEGSDAALREVRKINQVPQNIRAEVEKHLAKHPPVTVLPRRTLFDYPRKGQVTIPAGADCLVLLEGTAGCPNGKPPTDRAWGQGMHQCLGRDWSMPLIATLVHYALRLPGLVNALDPLTGEPLGLERLWGFGSTRYPLQFERDRYRVQSNLIVSMRIKPPISENAMALRALIAAAAPRIEDLLAGFGAVHFAWFEFTDGDRDLVLRTIFDGQFEPYVLHFALKGGELFDGLFQHLENAPPSPVAEHPQEFVETLRRLNRGPFGGYLYSAYPTTKAQSIR